VTLHLRVTPNAGVDRIDGTELRDDGSAVLRVRNCSRGWQSGLI